MAKADVLTLVDDIAGLRSDSNTLDDQTATDRYYSEAVYDYAVQRDGNVDASYVAVVAGTAEYNQPTAAVVPLTIHYGATQLRPTGRRAVAAYNPSWRTVKGTPRSFTTVDESWRTWRLIPVPNHSGEAIGAATPFEAEMPADNLLFISTVTSDDVPAIDELWLTFDILAREFSRESDHRDALFAKTCQQLTTLFRTLVGFEEMPRGNG